MTDPQPKAPGDHALDALIERLDRPLLGLALASMGLYVLDIYGVPEGWPSTLVDVLTFTIDAIFTLDLIAKIVGKGKGYFRSPWFLIDVLSCLPILDTLASGLLNVRAVRFFRGFRLLRVLRGLRVIRGLRDLPGFERSTREAREPEAQKQSHRAMTIGMLALTVAMLITIVAVRRSMELDLLRRFHEATTHGLSPDRLVDLGGSLKPPGRGESVLRQTALIEGKRRVVYFNLREIDRRVDQFEFFLTLGMMFSMIMFMYIMSYHHKDVTEAQLRGLLNLALPRQVTDQFLNDPNAYTRKTREPATVVFMDFVGFTETCEAMAHDPDLLSSHLERAMDRLVGELSRHDLIIDKFIGDAVMSFRGGPLVSGSPSDHARRSVRASIASTRALRDLNDPYFRRVKIGGASASDCLIGAFGTSARLSYTILGDGVNLAARLEPACGQCGTLNLFDATTRALCHEGGNGEFVWRRWGQIRVAGKAEPVHVFEAFGREAAPDANFLATFESAVTAFEAHEIAHARDLFLEADAQRPGGDEPSRLYAQRCDDLLRDGLPDDWLPVFKTHK